MPAKLIFSPSIEALLGVIQGRIKPETRAALADLRIGPPHRLEPAYPAENWASAVKLVSADLFPGNAPELQHRKLGAATLQRFADSFMGKSMFGLARLLGPRRSLDRMTRNLRTGANYIETRFTVIDEKTFELWINDVTGVPGFYAGLLCPEIELIPGWPKRVEIKKRDGEQCWYELRHA